MAKVHKETIGKLFDKQNNMVEFNYCETDPQQPACVDITVNSKISYPDGVPRKATVEVHADDLLDVMDVIRKVISG